ncbi:hypothetical protein DID80_08350 [Candidatus Marinamargulisbacteria bacterium SCGC AAA071-K20]|nr:hypothetical protein DID80_08350 [Candidatus Marinamargulisbacteria bacterium SCGC AAA071-K20]
MNNLPRRMRDMKVQKLKHTLLLILSVAFLFQGSSVVAGEANVTQALNSKKTDIMMEHFRLSVINDDIAQANSLLNKHPKVIANYHFEDDFDSLYYAVLNEQFEIVKLLLDSGVDPNHKDQELVSMLHWASAKESVAIASLLLIKGATISIRDADGATPLHWAAVVGSRPMIEVLIDNGADIHSHDKWKYSPLDWAIIKGNDDVVDLLVNRGIGITSGIVSL